MKFKPDLLVIPECESIEKLGKYTDEINYTNFLWIGENPNKGIGVFSFKNFKLKLHAKHNKTYKYIVPAIVTQNEKLIFNLLAFWVQKSERNYTEYTHKAIQYYSNFIQDKAVLIGDFNSNKIWDKVASIGNHSQTIEMLNQLNIKSVYHHFRNEAFGEEQEATFYMYHQEDKPYHIDYCFVSESLLKKIEYIDIGKYDDWCKLSDHCPLMINIKLFG